MAHNTGGEGLGSLAGGAAVALRFGAALLVLATLAVPHRPMSGRNAYHENEFTYIHITNWRLVLMRTGVSAPLDRRLITRAAASTELQSQASAPAVSMSSICKP